MPSGRTADRIMWFQVTKLIISSSSSWSGILGDWKESAVPNTNSMSSRNCCWDVTDNKMCSSVRSSGRPVSEIAGGK